MKILCQPINKNVFIIYDFVELSLIFAWPLARVLMETHIPIEKILESYTTRE